jgi:ribosomal protein S18 acetylase RimI-like enzyme
MSPSSQQLNANDAEVASALIQCSFNELAAQDWENSARAVFLQESSPAALRTSLESPAFSAGTFSGAELIGLIVMPKPTVLSMLFVHPGRLRQGIGRHLWEQARAHIEATYPAAKTVELNSTPYALGFYRSLGFTPLSAEFRLNGCRATRMACWLPARALGAEAL